ncbi:MAG: hypothetical protein H6510_18060 [Acidobacteria bacterium]|nr:hypothetical protein [Acidobacteriota bacterium]
MTTEVLQQLLQWQSDCDVYEPALPTVFAWVLWENFGYLARPANKFKAWKTWVNSVGIRPQDILRVDAQTQESALHVGILPQNDLAKIRKAAELAMSRWQGDPDKILGLSRDQAIRALREFPSIGLPGAEKILLFLGKYPSLAPESNGLRVLQRLGWISNLGSYSALYKRAQEFADALSEDPSALQTYHRRLKFLGQTICKAKRPSCGKCPLDSFCPKAGVKADV